MGVGRCLNEVMCDAPLLGSADIHDLGVNWFEPSSARVTETPLMKRGFGVAG